MKISKTKIQILCKSIERRALDSKRQVAQAVNVGLLYTYWHTGKLIVTVEQSEGYDEASSNHLLEVLSTQLTGVLGRGFSRPNLFYMRLFFMKFKYRQTVSDNLPNKLAFRQTVSDNFNKATLQVSPMLSWSHYIELLKCGYEEEIKFYFELAIREKLGVRELKTHRSKALFERVVLSKTKKNLPAKPRRKEDERFDDFYRDPLILEFLGISSNYKLTEKRLEQRILDNLQRFILELGKGFAFVSRQYRVTVDGRHYHADLVFYHYILKCFVIIDLKTKEIQHEDIGQMNFYINYFKKEVNTKTDQPPIGIILTHTNNQLTVEYALGNVTNKIFVKKYQLYLPDKKLLEKKVREFLKK
jgi:predicted nuclease of restriction endonuclease-like (RecB) superfamily